MATHRSQMRRCPFRREDQSKIQAPVPLMVTFRLECRHKSYSPIASSLFFDLHFNSSVVNIRVSSQLQSARQFAHMAGASANGFGRAAHDVADHAERGAAQAVSKN